MKIQLNTDKNIQGDESVAGHVDTAVEHALGRFRSQITRIEVHLSDLNANKSGAHDKRCVMEARLESRNPVAVTHEADTVRESINGAAQKLQRLLESSLGKLSATDRKGLPVTPVAPLGVDDADLEDVDLAELDLADADLPDAS